MKELKRTDKNMSSINGNLIDEDDIKTLEKSVIYISELEKRDELAKQIIKDFILENARMCREFNDNKFLFNSDYIERAEKFIKGNGK